MDAIRKGMNPFDHCPECGALMVRVPGGALCPHCGLDCDDPEDRTPIAFDGWAGSRGEGVRFHLADDRQAA